MKLRLANDDETLSGPARVCAFCQHAAHLHREKREGADGYWHGATSCIGDGPGFACGCLCSCQEVNSSNLVPDQTAKPRKLQLVVTHTGNRTRYYPISLEDGGWKMDTETREIVIGKGVPRIFTPMDNVLSYAVEEYP